MTISVFTVTPPDIRMCMSGPTVMLLGTDRTNSKPYIEMCDRLFPDVEVTVYVRDSDVSADITSWLRAAAGMASTFIVNLDNITMEELMLALQAEQDNRAMVFWVSQGIENTSLVALLNSYQYQIFWSLSDVEKFLIDEYKKM